MLSCHTHPGGSDYTATRSNPEKDNMRRIRWLFALALVALPSMAFAQERGTIVGVVTDQATQQPMVGVQVQISGTQLGAVTDAQGRFIILNVPAGTRTVRTTLIGYSQGQQTVTVTAGGTANVAISLTQTAIELDQIVVSAVTGQAERRRELGTNVSTINTAEINQAQITKVADVLTARAPGVSVMSAGGSTGTNQRIRIRGANSLSLSNEPLIFVDGVPFSNQTFGLGAGGTASNRLNDINPDDITSIEVLKGPAATSVYGTAAANGVVLITTRRGVSGAARWNFYSEVASIQDRNQYPDNWITYQVNTPGAPLFNPNGTANIGATAAAARRRCHNHEAAQGLCRQDETAVFNTLMDPRTTPFSDGFRRKYGMNVQGGGDRATFYLSGDMEAEQGVVNINTLDRANFRANLNATVTDRLNVSLSSGYTNSDLRINSDNNSVISPLINGLVGRAFFNPDSATFFRNYRSFSPAEIKEINPREAIHRLTLGGTSNFQATHWLSVNGNAGMDWVNRFYESTLNPNRAVGAIAPASWGIGWREAYRSNQFLWSLNASGVASFRPTERIATTSTAGGSFQRDLFQNQYGYGAGIVEGTRSLGTSTGQFSLNEGFTELRTVGAFVSQQVALDDRLFLTVGIRGDDNSAFGSDFGFVTYPNANLSWVVNEEGWFPQTDVISTLRVRAGYGTSGLRPGFRQAVTLFGPTGVQVAGADQPAVMLSTTGNPGLSPERTTEYETGFDASLFNDRLSAQFTYYNKTSRDALISVPLPPSFGLTGTRLSNLGRVRNSGIEVGLDARVFNYDRNQAALNLRIATTTLNNEVLDIGGVNDILVARGDQRHRVGFPAGAFFQDRYVYEDRNGDGKIDPRAASGEIRIVRDSIDGAPIPNYIGPSLATLSNALSADLTLFRFITISSLFEHRGGHYQLDFTTEFRCRTMVGFNDRGCEFTSDPNASIENQARYIGSAALGTRWGYIYPADFIKWREMSVSIGVPERFQHVRGLRGASLTFAGRNLATWTDYPGLDPEITEAGGGNFNQNEFNTQPPVRHFTARLNFTF
jgi:TonB-dependent starch-binding outer membrane protein SusC